MDAWLSALRISFHCRLFILCAWGAVGKHVETYVKVGNLSTKRPTKAQLDGQILLEFPRS